MTKLRWPEIDINRTLFLKLIISTRAGICPVSEQAKLVKL
jgi:hypothetical protein